MKLWILENLKCTSQGGFTLLELLVTIAILGVSIAASSSKISEIARSFNRHNARYQLESNILRYRVAAQASGARVVMNSNNSGRSFTFGYDRLPFSDEGVADEIISTITMPVGISVSIDQVVIFNPQGYVVSISDELVNRSISLAYDGKVFCSGSLFPAGVLEYDCI